MRLCTTPGCSEAATVDYRCRDHNRERNRRYTSPNKPVYNSRRWTFTRRRKLFTDPFCAVCGGIAEDVHHIIDIEDGGAVWSLQNLQSLCHAHHSQLSRARQLQGRRLR
jgi:hypothetical protein